MTGAIQTGQYVRYSRTGTSGTVIRIEDREGILFAELDSTGLLYRADLLIPAQVVSKPKTGPARDDIEQIRTERDYTERSDLKEPENLDGACTGAG